LELTGLVLGEDTSPGGLSRDTTAHTATVAVTKLDDARIQRLRGTALKAMMQHLAAQDEDYPTDGTADDVRNYNRRLRKIAFRALNETEHEEQASAMTQSDVAERLNSMKHSTFADAVLEKARRMSADAQTGAENVDSEDEFEGFGDDSDEDDQPEPDAELGHQNSDNLELHVTEGELFNTSVEYNLGYQDVARSFMMILMESQLSVDVEWKDRSGDQKSCPLCVQDPTITEYREWPSEAYLSRHMASTKYTAHYEWRRGQQIANGLRSKSLLEKARLKRREAETKEGSDQTLLETQAREYEREAKRFICPYCPESARSHSEFQSVYKHVQASTAEKNGNEHDRLKREDGWYNGADFFGEITKASVHRKRSKVKAQLTSVGFDWDYGHELPAPQPHPKHPHMSLGFFGEPGDIPPEFAGQIFRGSHPGAALISAPLDHQLKDIQFGGGGEWYLEPGQLPGRHDVGIIRFGSIETKKK